MFDLFMSFGHRLLPVGSRWLPTMPRTQGLVFTGDMNDANRSWTRRWQVEQRVKYPSSTQAGVYSSIIHYLKPVEALKADGKFEFMVERHKPAEVKQLIAAGTDLTAASYRQS
jgi:hypothetical protein